MGNWFVALHCKIVNYILLIVCVDVNLLVRVTHGKYKSPINNGNSTVNHEFLVVTFKQKAHGLHHLPQQQFQHVAINKLEPNFHLIYTTTFIQVNFQRYIHYIYYGHFVNIISLQRGHDCHSYKQ